MQHQVRIVSVESLSNPGGPIYPGEKVQVTLAVTPQPTTDKVKAAKLKVDCGGFRRGAKKVESKGGELTLTRTVGEPGTYPVTLIDLVNCTAAGGSQLVVEPLPTVFLDSIPNQYEVPRANQGDAKGYRVGKVNLRVKLDKPAPKGGASVDLVSAAIKGGKKTARIKEGLSDAPVTVELVAGTGHSQELKLDDAKGCQLPRSSARQIGPVLPEGTLSWAEPDGASKQYSPGTKPRLKVTLDYPAPESIKVYVSGECLVAAKHTDGKERTCRATIRKDRAEVIVEPQLDPKKKASTYPLTLETKHKKDFLPQQGSHQVEVDFAPQYQVSFPERWIEPDKKHYHQGEQVAVTVVIDRNAEDPNSSGLTLATLELKAKGGAARSWDVTFEPGAAQHTIEGIALEEHDLATTFKLTPVKEKATKGDKVERKLKVHQLNEVYFRGTDPKKGPFFEGSVIDLRVRLKYPCDGLDQASAMVADVVEADSTSGVLAGPEKRLPVEIADGQRDGRVQVTLGKLAAGKEARLKLVAHQQQGQGGTTEEVDRFRFGKPNDKEHPSELVLDLSDKRELWFGEEKPHLEADPEVTEPPFYTGEKVVVPVRLSTPVGTDWQGKPIAKVVCHHHGTAVPTNDSTVTTGDVQPPDPPAPPDPNDPPPPASGEPVAMQVAVPVKVPRGTKAKASKKPTTGRPKVDLSFSFTTEQAGAFSARAGKKKGLSRTSKPASLTFRSGPAPLPVLADPPLRTPEGGTEKVPEPVGLYVFALGEEVTLRIGAEDDLRPPGPTTRSDGTQVDGIEFEVFLEREKGTAPRGGGSAPAKVKVGAGSYTLADWKAGKKAAELTFKLDHLSDGPVVDPQTGVPGPEPIDRLVVRKVVPPPGGGKKKTNPAAEPLPEQVLELRVLGEAQVGFSAAESWITRQGETEKVGTLHPGDTATFRLALTGARPRSHGGGGGGGGGDLRVLFTSTPAGAIKPLPLVAGQDGTQMPQDYDATARGTWITIPGGSSWRGEEITFDALLEKRATHVGLAAKGPGGGGGGGGGKAKFTVPEAQRELQMGVGRTVQFAPVDEGQGLWFSPDRAVYPEEKVTFRFKLNDVAQPGEVLCWIQSKAFGQHRQMPPLRGDDGQPVKDPTTGKPKRMEETPETRHLAQLVVDLDGLPLPGMLQVVVPPEGDPAEGDFYDPQRGVFAVSFEVSLRPLFADPNLKEVFDVDLVDDLKRRFTTGDKQQLKLEVRPLPIVKFALEQPDLPEAIGP